MKQKQFVYETKQVLARMRGQGAGTKREHLERAERIGAFMHSQGLNGIDNMKLKHVERFMESLADRGLSESTRANYASTLRMIADRIGKGDMIAKSNEKAFGFARTATDRYQPVVRSADERLAAEKFTQRIENHGRTDTRWVALGYRMSQEFGLRRKEAVKSTQVVERDGRQYLVVEGAKGGRPRQVEITTDVQKHLLTEVRQHLKETGGKSLMPPDLTQKQALQQYSNVVSRAGGTKDVKLHTHANRHQNLQDQAAAGATAKEIADRSGHGREEVAGHYVTTS